MKTLIILFILFPLIAQADLLARMNLEEAFRQRIETMAKTYDPDSRVLIRFDYRSMQGSLPGTSLTASNELPARVDISDIVRANIEIYTVNSELPADFSNTIYKILPVPKSVIKINSRKLDIQKDAQIVRDIDAKSLNEIATQSVNNLTEKLIYLFSILMALIFLGFSYISQRRMKDFKAQMSLLTSAVADSVASATGPQLSAISAQNKLPSSESAGNLQFKINSLNGLPDTALLAMLADCYWCERDSEAAWIWRMLESKRKIGLMSGADFLKHYSYYLQGVKDQETSLFEDTYYFHPQSYNHLSNKDLTQLVEKYPFLWHQLSPTRQKYLPLAIESKLRVQTSNPEAHIFDFQSIKPSPTRTLQAMASVTYISHEDELKILSDPLIVPIDLRKQFPTLVWLAQKDSETISKILSKYDARSLAMAWTGPEETLKKLETCLPERKVKILRSYIEKNVPDRSSEIFRSLYLEGLRDDVA